MTSSSTKITFITLIIALIYSNYERTLDLWARLSPSTAPNVDADVFENCSLHNYTTEIISVDPLLIYINSFVTDNEAASLVSTASPLFKASQVFLHGRKVPSKERTSQSAALPFTSPAVGCVLARARQFMGSVLPPTGEFSTPQLVRYSTGEKFDLHHDWYDSPQTLQDGRRFNRPSSFFVFLESNCTQGETYFPYIKTPEILGTEEIEGLGKWRAHADGGTAFKPVVGNALFWVNLMPSGEGDKRVMHAGLPLGEGRKTAMNIWPRIFYE